MTSLEELEDLQALQAPEGDDRTEKRGFDCSRGQAPVEYTKPVNGHENERMEVRVEGTLVHQSNEEARSRYR